MKMNKRSRVVLTLGMSFLAACGGDARESSSQSGGTGASSGVSSAGDDGDGDGDGGSGGSATATGGTSATTTGGTGGTGSTTGGTGGTTGGTSATTGGTSAGDTGGIRLDVGAATSATGGGGEGTPSGCEKVDFLFVVDNSGSMAAEQANLANSFPGFISEILNNPKLQDFRIMVLDTDAGGMGGCVGNSVGCTGANCCIDACMGAPCGSVCNGTPCPGSCGYQLGAGKTWDINENDCGVPGGIRYMLPTQPDLNGTFSCLAQVGTMGDGNEQQAGTMVASVSPALVGPGGCNEGFLRDDAILVVTLISDEEDGPEVDGSSEPIPDSNSPGNAASWKQALVDAKHGDENALVMLGFIGDSGSAGGLCQPLSGANGAENAAQLRTFFTSFPFGEWHSVCEPDYTPFFVQAVSIITEACDTFIPPG